MGLALCHIIPRDNIMRFCVLMLCVSFILQAIAVGKRKEPGSLGTFFHPGDSPLYLNANLLVFRADGTVVCDTGTPTANVPPCLDYFSSAQAAWGLMLAAFITTPIAMLVISGGIVQLSSTTTAMVIGFWFSVLFPFLATLTATCLFFAQSVPSLQTYFGYGEDPFVRGDAAQLVIASCAFHCLGIVLATGRLLIALFLRKREKQEMIQSKNIESIMTLHMVNDDWARQKKVWASHKETVHLAMVEGTSISAHTRLENACKECQKKESHLHLHEPTDDDNSTLADTTKSQASVIRFNEPVEEAVEAPQH